MDYKLKLFLITFGFTILIVNTEDVISPQKSGIKKFEIGKTVCCYFSDQSLSLFKNIISPFVTYLIQSGFLYLVDSQGIHRTF